MPNISVDPLGLDPWYQETMRVYTDKIAGKTTIYNQGKVFEMETRNGVAIGAQPGADGAYSGTFTYCERVPDTAPDRCV